MHLSKKKKTILAWTIPSSILVLAATITTPIVITQEIKKYQKVNDAKDYVVVNFSQPQLLADKLIIDPGKFTFNYFDKVISQSESLMNNVFQFPSLNFKNNSWYDSEGIQYRILSGINSLVENSENYYFQIQIEKSYNGISTIYTQDVVISKNSFVQDEKEAYQNFVSMIAQSIFNYVNERKITVSLNPSKTDSINNLAAITSPADLNLFTSVVAMQMMKNSANGYNLNGNDFSYLGVPIHLSIPVDQGYLWNSTDAYNFDANGQFDKNSKAFVALKQEYTNGNLTFLPELTAEESAGLNTQDQIVDRKIQKLIFDPNVWAYDLQTNDSNGNTITNKVPLSSNQAIAIKISMNNNGQEASTYVVLWTNLFQPSASIVDNAPSIPLKIYDGPNGILTYENLKDPSTVQGNKLDNVTFWNTYIKPEQPPKNNLIYTIKNVDFASDDQYCTKALITVEISHPELANSSKEYTFTTQNGFLSKAYLEMDTELLNLMGPNLVFTKLSPTLSFKASVNKDDLINSPLDESTINSYLDLKIPNGLDPNKVQYKFKSAWLNGNKIQVTYNICSPNDPTKLWMMNGIVQDISAEIIFMQARVSTNT